MAKRLQSFNSVAEFNQNMNYHYTNIKDTLTKSYDKVFFEMKKHACKVAGVCWLKQSTIADRTKVSLPTVERAIKFLVNNGVIKVVHTKRKNGLNGAAYYVFQPYDLEAEEIIDYIEEVAAEVAELQNDGASEVGQALVSQGIEGTKKDVNLLSSLSSNPSLNPLKQDEKDNISPARAHESTVSSISKEKESKNKASEKQSQQQNTKKCKKKRKRYSH